MRITTAALISVSVLALVQECSAAAAEAEPKKVVCTVPTLTAIAREISGDDRVEYITLAKPDQDPHYVSPTPSLMRKTRDAALLFEVGMQLETWADEVANGSGNPRIFRGGPGRVRVSVGIPVEEVPPVITRAEGDVHPQGNPHVWLDPVRAKQIAATVAEALAEVTPDRRADIESRLRSFQSRIDDALYGQELVALVGARKLDRLVLDGALWPFLEKTEVGGEQLLSRLGGWLRTGLPLRGLRVVEYHKTWVYFAKTFGLELIGTIEEKPGIPPGPRHQREMADRIRRRNVTVILVDNFYDVSLPRRMAEDTGARMVVLPAQVGGEPGVDSYFELIDYLLDRLLGAVGSAPQGR
jgi:ABC-type Zn uptake system ZnuABC Zn-binding protein ZnuA